MAALASLGDMSTPTAMQTGARQILADFPSHLVLDALLRHLDTAHSQLRGGLGLLAQLLPRPETEQALLRTVLNRERSTHARLSAVTVLQDYLQRPVEPFFIQDITDFDSVILSSMQEAFAARETHPAVLTEYTDQFAQLDRANRDHVLGLLHRVSEPDATDLLYTMAYNRLDNVAAEAIDFLAARDSEAGVRALYILSQSLYLDPLLATKARTHLRRRQLRGGHFVPPAWPTEARAHFLGFAEAGTLHVQLSIPGLAYDIHIGYDIWHGISHMQKAPPIRDILSRVQGHAPQMSVPDLPADRIRWHVHHTLSRLSALPSNTHYHGMYQVLAPELWAWQPPETPGDAEALYRQADDRAAESPSSLARQVCRLPGAGDLRRIAVQRLAQQDRNTGIQSDSLARHLESAGLRSYAEWWLQANVFLLSASDRDKAALMDQAARCLSGDDEAAHAFLAVMGLQWELWT